MISLNSATPEISRNSQDQSTNTMQHALDRYNNQFTKVRVVSTVMGALTKYFVPIVCASIVLDCARKSNPESPPLFERNGARFPCQLHATFGSTYKMYCANR